MYSRVGAINNKQGTQWKLPKLFTYAEIKGGAKDIAMAAVSKCGLSTIQPPAIYVVDGHTSTQGIPQ